MPSDAARAGATRGETQRERARVDVQRTRPRACRSCTAEFGPGPPPHTGRTEAHRVTLTSKTGPAKEAVRRARRTLTRRQTEGKPRTSGTWSRVRRLSHACPNKRNARQCTRARLAADTLWVARPGPTTRPTRVVVLAPACVKGTAVRESSCHRAKARQERETESEGETAQRSGS